MNANNNNNKIANLINKNTPKYKTTTATHTNDNDNNTQTANEAKGEMPPSLPLTLCRVKVTQRQSGPGSHFRMSRQDLFSLYFSLPFLTQLKSQKASQDAPSWPPKSTQDRPGGVLRPLFFKKVDFSKNERRLGREHDFDPPGPPRWCQDQDGLKTVLKCLSLIHI